MYGESAPNSGLRRNPSFANGYNSLLLLYFRFLLLSLQIKLITLFLLPCKHSSVFPSSSNSDSILVQKFLMLQLNVLSKKSNFPSATIGTLRLSVPKPFSDTKSSHLKKSAYNKGGKIYESDSNKTEFRKK